MKTLTKQQIEFLSEYFQCFRRAYVVVTGTQLETAAQIMDVIDSGKFTFEDVFMAHLEEVFGGAENEVMDRYWEDHMEMFDYTNYFPGAKSVGEGSWIKIRTLTGFEVHYAKPGQRKHRFDEEMALHTKRLGHIEVTKPHAQEKISETESLFREAQVRHVIGLRPYEVRIQRTKSKTEYYMPYQYEIVPDIEEFSAAYMNSVTGVDAKMLFTSQNEDAVFYLQSRGIPKRTAQMMATLKQTYFIVNMDEALTEYEKQWKSALSELLPTTP